MRKPATPPSPPSRLDEFLAQHPTALAKVTPGQDAYSLSALSVFVYDLNSKGDRIFKNFFHIDNPDWIGDDRVQHAIRTNRFLRDMGRYFDGHDAADARGGHPTYI